MTVLLAIAVGLASLASLVTFVLGLGRSDPAGNGLAQAYVAIATAVTTGLVAIALLLALGHAPPAWPGSWIVTLGLAALALALPATTLPALLPTGNGPRVRIAVAASAMLGQQVLVLHAAWRGLAVPLPPAAAVTGCAAIAGCAVLAPVLASRRGRARPAGVFAIAYPALVVRAGDGVRVVRGADELTALDPTFLGQPPPAATVDANGTVWTVRPATALAGWTASPSPATLPIEAVRAQLLAIPRLHADPARDAELRRLVAGQRDVTALSFVLPKST